MSEQTVTLEATYVNFFLIGLLVGDDELAIEGEWIKPPDEPDK